ncbi:MAG: Hsp20/alpha crystallin family protein, partial [Candidatus Cloacimonetes bacterium]|nr:Hsp20/alpha crystallin family protein [Candidatus Cloacimonadota bacterium]
MKLVPSRRTSEINPMSTMLNMFDEFFNRAFEEDFEEENFRAMPMDIIERDKEYEILANLPGFKKDNVKITVHDNQL